MARRVRWTDLALDDLDHAAGYLAETSRVYAAAFVRDVRAASRSLRDLAERGRVVPEIATAKVRELFVQRYRLIYRIQDDEIEIVAFIHGARDLTTLLRDEPRS